MNSFLPSCIYSTNILKQALHVPGTVASAFLAVIMDTVLLFDSHNNPAIGTIAIPILYMRKLKQLVHIEDVKRRSCCWCCRHLGGKSLLRMEEQD